MVGSVDVVSGAYLMEVISPIRKKVLCLEVYYIIGLKKTILISFLSLLKRSSASFTNTWHFAQVLMDF